MILITTQTASETLPQTIYDKSNMSIDCNPGDTCVFIYFFQDGYNHSFKKENNLLWHFMINSKTKFHEKEINNSQIAFIFCAFLSQDFNNAVRVWQNMADI